MCELRRDAAPCQPRWYPHLVAPEAPTPQTVSVMGHALPWQCAAHGRMERGRSGVPVAVLQSRVGSASLPGPPPCPHEAVL